jgi:dTDP-4-amino-4,6-dideoxygalactose transaminase
MILFNKPYLAGNELTYTQEVLRSGRIGGDGQFTKRCHSFFEKKFGFAKCLLTTSCSDALEMSAILLDIQPGDEVIMPSFTFSSTANAFVLRGAKIVFADSRPDHPNIEVTDLERLVTPRTRVILAMHYAGIACDLEDLLQLCNKYKLYLVEDAAQCIDSYYNGKPLGSVGHLAAFSFHESKNVAAGEGGMLVINEPKFVERAEIIREKGTNRSKFFRGEADKYEWMDVGSSYLPSDLIAAVLYAQLEQLEFIQTERKKHWQFYYNALKPLEAKGYFTLPLIPALATNNAHMFYLVLNNNTERNALIAYLREKGVYAVFHYQSLHKSPFYASRHGNRPLPNADKFMDCLVRLPMFVELTEGEQEVVVNAIAGFFANK